MSSQCLIGGYQLLVDFRQTVRFPKLQIGTSLQQTADTFRFLYARQFHEDTSCRFQTLDIGGNYTEAVDTGTQYVERIVNGTFQFGFQYGNNLCIRALRGNLFFQVEGAEYGGQTGIRIQPFIFFGEQVDKVPAYRVLALIGCL
ncbi:hypothetical protein Barb7_00495 [Bacteroidales bacterium Barb7]|nr:hypothetical protein Barb7_00495 [Bacteroidales bacterium Barb7]